MNTLFLAEILHKLKRLPRTGWIYMQIDNPESVAEHSYGIALLAMLLAPQFDVDQVKVMKMALVHDLAEAEIGDIVSKIGTEQIIDISEKHEQEASVMAMLGRTIGNEELLTLFNEYTENKTNEAKFVKQLDRLEMALQAYDYEKLHQINMEEFFETSREDIHDPNLREILTELESLRRKL